MELIVISNSGPIADESIIVNNLFQSGLKYFHIRKPESDIQTVRELINGIAPRYYGRISLHQFHEIGPEYGIKRLHYTELARIRLNQQQLQSKVDDGFILSTSIHDISILPVLTHFDYAFYGPVFNSISKPGYQSKLPADFKLDKTNIKTKVIALGGVEACNLIRIKNMGFDGAAVLGMLWNEPHKAPEGFRQLKEACLFNYNNTPIQ
ncbi:thiamine-phosphate pyrophosphorylase [Mucilaginibacter mallensis]|uniref:Thiamine-phosphate pyrophosphorylase n=1 Tax=Mucilaginibacter mallensis TaxID=652787 RepID=A0A1H1XWX5_MUCMA|nr:thiamine phosphate synthase [Mucilaginibacter mallensis]SDT13768.1 thiamine-phosphate pyrophosphorylase [Mucilaginibacter mallensis]